MKTAPTVSTARMAEIYGEMVQFRREYCDDSHFFRMTEFWTWVCGDGGNWRIKLFRSHLGENYERKASVVSFADSAILTVDEELWARAKGACRFANFVLAHELSHLALDHHAKRLVVKHFQLFDSSNGYKSNIPPTVEELEANFAAVFFQCGVTLQDHRWTTIALAKRAFSDVEYVRKAQTFVRMEVFQRELSKPKPRAKRVIL